MKIGLSYINAVNLGDQIIFSTARYLVEKSLAENGVEDYEIIPVDICLTDKAAERHAGESEEEYLERENRRKEEEAAFFEKLNSLEDESEIFNMLTEEWHKSEIYSEFAATQAEKLKGLDLFIFAGGGLIKFHAQHYHHVVDEITSVCDEQNIPVFFLSVGVEGYNEEDARCRLLKNALNRNCVKYISVRDDIETMHRFITNPEIEVERVCDPAFWLKERYRIEEAKPVKGLIGLNGIRQAIWEHYMYPVERQLLHEVYHDLIIRLTEQGYRVELFSNGVHGDRAFLNGVINSYDDLKALKADKILTTYYPTNQRRLIQRIATYERFMGVRLHSTITGSVLGIPNVNLVWCVKQILFGEQTGTISNFLKKDEFDADIIYKKLMAAEPFETDPEYKNSVYNGINRRIRSFLRGNC